MANDYFTHSANRIEAGSRAIDTQIDNIADEIEDGFDKFPTEQQLNEGTARFAVDTGAADAYVVTVPSTVTLTDGLRVTLTAVNASTGACTINVNSLGAKAIINVDGTAMVAGSIPAGSKIDLIYDSGTDSFMLVSMNADWNGPSITVSEDGTDLTTRVESIDFTGDGVAVTEPTPNNIVVTIG